MGFIILDILTSVKKIKNVEIGNPYASTASTFIRLEGRSTVSGAPVGLTDSTELFEKWVDVIKSVLQKDLGTVAIVAHSSSQVERMVNLLTHRGITPVIDQEILRHICGGELLPHQVYLGIGDLISHAWSDERDLLILPESAIFGASRKKNKPASKKLQNYLSSFKDLKIGDLVVHVQHGIAKYQGMEEIEAGGLAGDFLILEYAGGDKIYLPVDRLSMLQKYAAEGGSHSLDKLGGQTWERRKSKVKGAVKDMADKLLRIQAQRELAEGHVYMAPDETFLKFEASFPYEETEDQLRALSDVEADIRSTRPMDRLICGDVGFGKTEVALRAAFRAVLEGYQVLVLVPTTVLCYQHFRTFTERLEHFGVRVGQVNRFVKSKEVKEYLSGLEKGEIDVLVGTHRLLSKDIKPSKLGLLVVDEEQRFGVGHKEKLKEMRAGADVLTLTATPIPRTLHMSMLGLRDISIIATPPQDRLSVKTYVSKFEENIIKDAMVHEINRGGQVFFVHNRVEDIEEVATFVRSLIPGSEVRTAHGQMREHQLEKQIVDFLDQKFPVLVCTTIIESGIDMPNVNTLIVNRADRFGLSQLYQIRGRVGRSSRQAYAYFLTPPEERLSDEAKKRLEVLAAYQDLGSGFQIASHDLEIRGAGNLVGGQQSGRIDEVGLELYTEMLETAIAELRGQKVKSRTDAEIKIPVAAKIPEEYIKNQNQRLHLYKKLFTAESDQDLESIIQDTEDRFGSLPVEFGRLVKVARLKQKLRTCQAKKLTVGGRKYLELKLSTLDNDKVDRLLEVVKAQPKKYKVAPNDKLYLFTEIPQETDDATQDRFLNRIISLIDPLAIALA